MIDDIDSQSKPAFSIGDGSRSLIATALKCCLAVGVSDALFAIVVNGIVLHRTPARVFRGVASVPFGTGALDGGLAIAGLGLVVHFGVALFWSAVYLLVTRGSPALRQLVRTRRGALEFAAVYGPSIWLTMSVVVIPAFTHRPPNFSLAWYIMVVGHIPFVVGPMVWASGDGSGR